MAENGQSGSRYIILMRHGHRDFGSSAEEADQPIAQWNESLADVQPDFGVAGLPFTLANAKRLRQELGHTIRIFKIFRSTHRVSEQTAMALNWVFGDKSNSSQNNIKTLAELTPDNTPENADLAELMKAIEPSKIDTGSAIVLIGHQPMLTSLATKLLGRRLPGNTLPIGNSEFACIEIDEYNRRTLIWMITKKSDQLLIDLRDKIKSKYDVAKFFLGAFVVNSGVVLSSQVWSLSGEIGRWALICGLIMMLVALALAAATLLSYDRLLMPTNFWSTQPQARMAWTECRFIQRLRFKRRSLKMPPTEAQIILFHEMMRAWKNFFIPCLLSAFIAIACFVIGLMFNNLCTSCDDILSEFATIASIVSVAITLMVILLLYYIANRPALGTDD